ncbi:MAG: serine/threonine protein kinase [Sandaracinaceae bacterium]|nr:serine/threonine protein kinase [Sandaracinaceae bacterium]
MFTDPELVHCPHDGAKLTADSPQTLVDRVVGGRYRILAHLGEGGMGTVYAAEHTLSLRRVALKIIRPELESSRIARERFLRECKTLERVQSPNVVSVLEAGESAAGEIYLVMELLEGESLGDRIAARGALPLAEAIDVALQVCAALRAAHARDVVHRDLKPDNVFLCRDVTVRVLDFGIARLLDADTSEGSSARRLTRTGTIVGTPAYISPEGAGGEEVGPAADLYSFGVVLFEMLTGRLPFEEEHPVLLMGKHLKEPPPSLREARADLAFPDELVALVARLLAKSPADRPANAESLHNALAAVKAAMQGARESVTREVAVVERAPSTRAFPWIVAGAIGGVAALVLAAVAVAALVAEDDEPAETVAPAAEPRVEARVEPPPRRARSRPSRRRRSLPRRSSPKRSSPRPPSPIRRSRRRSRPRPAPAPPKRPPRRARAARRAASRRAAARAPWCATISDSPFALLALGLPVPTPAPSPRPAPRPVPGAHRKRLGLWAVVRRLPPRLTREDAASDRLHGHQLAGPAAPGVARAARGQKASWGWLNPAGRAGPARRRRRRRPARGRR